MKRFLFAFIVIASTSSFAQSPEVDDCAELDAGPVDGGLFTPVDAGPVDGGSPVDGGLPFPETASGHTRLNVVEDCNLTNKPTLLERTADSLGFADPYDDLDAFYECQADLVAAGGGELFFPAGTYDFNAGHVYQALNIASNVQLIGESKLGTVLQDNNPNNASRLLGTVWPDSRTVSNIAVKHLTVRGARTFCGEAGVYQSHGMFFHNVNNVTIEDVRVENVKGDGLYFYRNVHDVVIADYETVDFCRDSIVINSGHPVVTSSGFNVTNIRAFPASDAPYGYDFDVETGVDNLLIHDVDVRVIHLAGAINTTVSNSTIRRHIIGGYGDNVTFRGVNFLYGGTSNINLDHSGRWFIDGCSFECGQEAGSGGDGTCIYVNGVHGDDTGSVLSNSTFKCVTPELGCYAPLKRLSGSRAKMHNNQVFGPDDGKYVAPPPAPNLHFKYGFVNDQSASGVPGDTTVGHSTTVVDNFINVSDWCVSVGSASGIQGILEVRGNYFNCAVGVKTNYPPHDYPMFIGPNLGTQP